MRLRHWLALAGYLVFCGIIMVGLQVSGVLPSMWTTAQGKALPAEGKPIRSAAPVAPTTPAPVLAAPVATDFTVTITIIEKQCFGSAGCNLRFRITPAYSGVPLASSQSFTIIYEITGGDSPQTNSFTLQGDTASFNEEEFIQTKSSAVVPTAKVTQVLPN